MILLRAILFAIGAMVLNVAVAFLWVWIYSMLIAPGHDEAHYQAYAMRAAPISSIIAGIPILFAAGWLAGRREPARPMLAGLLVAVVYVAIDASIVFAVADSIPYAILATSFGTKLAAAAAGGRMAGPRDRTMGQEAG